jgi:hypothetical protein
LQETLDIGSIDFSPVDVSVCTETGVFFSTNETLSLTEEEVKVSNEQLGKVRGHDCSGTV